MTQLDEANEIISRAKNVSGNPYCRSVRQQEAQQYYDKYLKPKDPLFEKLKEFIGGSRGTDYMLSEDGLVYFKQIFADELNGTKGLVEAIEHVKGHKDFYHMQMICLYLESLKHRLEK